MTPATAASLSTSSYCRRGEHRTCKDLGAKCGCACHGPGGQTPTSVAKLSTGAANGGNSPAPAKQLASVAPVGDGIIWEDPPPPRGGPRRHLIAPELLDALRADPGRWARVKTYGTKTSAQTARAKIAKGALGPGWEVVARQIPGGSALWLRWVGK